VERHIRQTKENARGRKILEENATKEITVKEPVRESKKKRQA